MRALYLAPLLSLATGCHSVPCKNGDSCEREIHVKAPQQKIVVDVPESCPAPTAERLSAPVSAPQSATAPAPTMMGSPAASPQFAMTSPGTVMAVSQPQAQPLVNTTQSVRAPRTKLAMGLTTIHIPFPCLKFFEVPVPGEVTTTSTIPAPQTQSLVQVPQPQIMSMPMQQFAAPQMQMVAAPQMQMMAAPAQQPVVVAAPVQAAAVRTQAAADCPPVNPQTLLDLEKELVRAREILNRK